MSIRFSGLKSRLMGRKGFAVEKARHADVYVFCVLNTKDARRFDPLDLTQWEFHILTHGQLDELTGGSDTVSLSALQKRSRPCAAGDLRATFESVAANTGEPIDS